MNNHRCVFLHYQSLTDYSGITQTILIVGAQSRNWVCVRIDYYIALNCILVMMQITCKTAASGQLQVFERDEISGQRYQRICKWIVVFQLLLGIGMPQIDKISH